MMRNSILFIIFVVVSLSVSAQQADLMIVWPSEGFFTTGQPYLVPLNTEVCFNAQPENASGWRWELPGATPALVEEKEAIVVYTEEGLYDVYLDATVAGVDKNVSALQTVQAGGANFVWNIADTEEAKLETIPLAWYGYYGGTNWLGITKFAEFFHSPMQTAFIDSVAVRFGSTDIATPNTELTLTIAALGDDGMPGEELGAVILPASEVNTSAGNDTYFHFAKAVKVEGPFFVVISGFPNAAGDGLAMQCVRREMGQPCTAYHLVADEDSNYQPTGTYTWYQNVDDPTSFAVCPWLRYETSSGVENMASFDLSAISTHGSILILPSGVSHLELFNASGMKVMTVDHPSEAVSIESLSQGIYLVCADGMIKKIKR